MINAVRTLKEEEKKRNNERKEAQFIFKKFKEKETQTKCGYSRMYHLKGISKWRGWWTLAYGFNPLTAIGMGLAFPGTLVTHNP